MNKSKNQKNINRGSVLLTILKALFNFYPVLLPIVIICIIFDAVISSLPSLFMQKIIAIIEDTWQAGNWQLASHQILRLVGILIIFYGLSLAATTLHTQLMAIITQGSLAKMREEMFDRMQDLPIKYFDTHYHGDVMSYYTNDIDALRQLISQSLPNLFRAGILCTAVLFIMLYYSLWLTLTVLCGVIIMLILARIIGGAASRYFLASQKSVAKTEAFVEEMMNGQKVIKVFCHEKNAKKDFDKVNQELFRNNSQAHLNASILMPILNNIGYIMYVVIALLGGYLMLINFPNISISGMTISISIVVPFLNMTRQFTGNIGQMSNQLNSIVMGLAGTRRIMDLINEEPEKDEGYVTLVNAKEDEKGGLIESMERTGIWAWKHPHRDGTITFTRLSGDVRMVNVDFAYEEDKTILHDITLHAKPGEKIAFVGSTGAGKTTITNLINRFYDVEDGKIRYDGINITKIKKPDLRRSLGQIWQDTSLFTGTVLENIRYGRLDATDDECIAAAKLAGADDFITRLPNGYGTQLSGNGSNLSQGQMQLLSIARAAVCDPPVLIMDEATSSIDTRTEAIVQRGMDALMKGRTVFVIAHRLSTVQNSNAIIVLEHGRIIERGSHDELIKLKGTYYQLYTGALELE